MLLDVLAKIYDLIGYQVKIVDSILAYNLLEPRERLLRPAAIYFYLPHQTIQLTDLMFLHFSSSITHLRVYCYLFHQPQNNDCRLLAAVHTI